MLGYLFTGLSFGFYAAVSPGPLQTFLLAESLQKGWKRTLPAALAPLLSDVPIVSLVLLVLTQTPDGFLSALRVVGGGFILFLAWGTWKTVHTASAAPETDTRFANQSVWKAAMMNLLNPNPYIFWSVVGGPILLAGWRQSPAQGVSFMGGFYSMLIGGSAVLIVLFATARNLGDRATRGLAQVSAGVLALFGAYQLWQGIINLL